MHRLWRITSLLPSVCDGVSLALGREGGDGTYIWASCWAMFVSTGNISATFSTPLIDDRRCGCQSRIGRVTNSNNHVRVGVR